MADVTSTARLIVTVEGEGKIRALAAQIKALQGLSGSKRIGGVGGPAQMVAQNVAMKRAAGQMVAQTAATTRAVKQVSASQAITGRMLAPLAGQQKQTAKIITPMVAQQAVLAKTTSDLTAHMLRAEKARAAVLKRGREVFPEQAPAAAGLTPGLIASLQKRNLGMTEAEARRAATGGTRNLPQIGKKDLASAAAQGWMTREAAAAGVAALAAKPAVAQAAAKAAGGGGGRPRLTPSQRALTSFGTGAVSKTLAAAGVPAAIGTGVGQLARGLGAAAAAAVPLAAAAGAMTVGFKSANAQAEDLVTNTGKALKSRREVDEVEARQAAGEAVFGKNYEQLEKRIPKLLSEQRAKRGIAGEKGLFARMGLDPAHVAKLEKAGKRLDTYDIGEIFAKKREQLEAAVAGAKTPKAADEAKKRLDKFWKDVGLFGPEMVRATAFGSEALQRFREQQDQIQQAYGAGLADEKTQLRQAQDNVLLRANIGSQFKEAFDRIGTISMPGVNAAMAAFNAKMMELGPTISTTLGQFSRLGWEGIAASINSIDSGKMKTAFDDLNKALSGQSWETLDVGKIVSGLGTAIGTAFGEIDWSGQVSAATGKLPGLVGTALSAAFTAGMTGLGDSIGEGIDNMINVWKGRYKWLFGGESEFEKKTREEKEKAEAEAKKPPEERPATFDERFPSIQPKRVDVQSDQTTVTPTAPAVTPPAPAPAAAVPAIAPPAAAAPGKVTPALPTVTAPPIVPDLVGPAQNAASTFNSTVQSGITAAGSSGGNAFSQAASAGITAAGSAGGTAFNAAVNGSAIGAAIGSAAASIISNAKVTVSIPSGATAGGGARGSPGSPGTDTPDSK